MYFKLLFVINCLSYVYSNNVSVEINQNLLTNIVSREFLSFNVDSYNLFDSKGFLRTNKLSCLAKTLSPAYLRVNGPTSDSFLLENKIVRRKSKIFRKNASKRDEFSFEQLGLLLDWMQSSNFTPFVVINNNNRLVNNEWNTKLATRILSLADSLEVGDSVWQLKNDCTSLGLSNYMEDTKVFNSILETFGDNKNEKWLISAGDISQCLNNADNPQEEFKTLLSSNILNAMIMNNYSHLEVLDDIQANDPEVQDVILYKTLENDNMLPDDERAIHWLNTLGIAGFNGYAAVFRNLNDMSSSSLVYYSSLLYKKIVGRRVLHISENTPDKDISVFAHCATLASGPIPGGVTIYATNLGTEKKSVSIDLAVDDDNAEIMQYVLNLNENGTIIINEQIMESEEDLKPIVQKVKSFKTLRVILPPKSFGFWVVSNTNINVCMLEEEFVENLYNNLNDKRKMNNATEEQFEDHTVGDERSKRGIDDGEFETTLAYSEIPETKILDVEISDTVAEGSESHKSAFIPFNNGNNDAPFQDGIRIDPERVDIILNQAKAENKISSLEDVFTILGQLSSLLELQEEFLDISSSIFKSPITQMLSSQNKMDKFINDTQELQNVFSSLHNAEVIRVGRSADHIESTIKDNFQASTDENYAKVINEISRLTRGADCKTCSNTNDVLRREKINVILNSLRNKQISAINFDKNLLSNPLNIKLNNPFQRFDIPLVGSSLNTNDNDMVVPDETNISNNEDIPNLDDENVGSELELKTNPNPKKPFIVDPEFMSNEDEEEVKLITTQRTLFKMPTLKPFPKLKKFKIPALPKPSLNTTRSLKNLVRKAKTLLVNVDPKSEDDETLESKILVNRVGAPAPLPLPMPLPLPPPLRLPVIPPPPLMEPLAIQIQRDRLRIEELRQKIHLKLNELRTNQILSRGTRLLRKRSIDYKSKSEARKALKKIMQQSLDARGSKKDPRLLKEYKKGKAYMKDALYSQQALREKRMISNDIDDDDLDFDKKKFGYKGKNSDDFFDDIKKLDLIMVTDKYYDTSKMTENAEEITTTTIEMTEETVTEKYENEPTIRVKYIPNADGKQNTKDLTFEGLQSNLNSTVSWLNNIVNNLVSFVTSIKDKIAKTSILSLY